MKRNMQNLTGNIKKYAGIDCQCKPCLPTRAFLQGRHATSPFEASTPRSQHQHCVDLTHELTKSEQHGGSTEHCLMGKCMLRLLVADTCQVPHAYTDQAPLCGANKLLCMIAETPGAGVLIMASLPPTPAEVRYEDSWPQVYHCTKQLMPQSPKVNRF